MNKNEFLQQLAEELRALPQDERDAAVQYFAMYFEDAGPEREEEVLRGLGSPAAVAAGILAEAQADNGSFKSTSGENKKIFVPDKDKLRRVQISSRDGKVYVKRAAVPSIFVEGFGAPVDSNFDEATGTWKLDIRSTPITERLSSLLRHLNVMEKPEKGPVYTICLPDGLEELAIKAGMGSIVVEELAANDVNLRAEMGSLVAQKIHAKTGSFSAEMGSMKIEQFDGETCTLTAGVGVVRFNGQVADTLHVDCSMGRVQANLPRPQNYNWTAQGGSGSISVDGKWIAGVFGVQGEAPQAKPNFDLKCGMGSIAVTFDEQTQEEATQA
ncbi:MAG: DUF4097 family beta strand repeat-containing protein [Oscillospiraceae bacterium]